jgi:ammonia channel protein AmtB
MSKIAALRQRLDLVAVMITVIIAGVVGYVGINIMSNTQESTNLTSTDPFYDSQQNLTDGLQQFFSQLGTVFTVIVLVVIIAYLMLLRRR